MSSPLPKGVAVSAPLTPEFSQILTPEALAFVATLHRQFESRRQELLAARAARQRSSTPASCPDFLPETAKIRDADWKIAPQAGGPARPARRDHRARRPQDGHQRAQLRRATFMADFEDSNSPDLGQHRRGADQPARRRAPHDRLRSTGGKRYALNDETAVLIVRPRGWHLAEKHVLRRRRAGLRRALRLRPVLLPQRARAARARQRALLLPAEAGEPPRGAAVERRLRAGPGRSSASRSGTIKATVLIETILAAFEMDEILLRAARALGRPQLRPLGLHLQLHQEVPRATPSSCLRRPRAGDDDRATSCAPTRCC